MSTANTATADRKFHVTPLHLVSLNEAEHPLTKIKPKTKLGQVALEFAQASAVTTISVASVSAYVYAVTQAAAPIVQFRTPPKGTNIDIKKLQTEYTNFQNNFATLQGQLSVWINTDQNSAQSSIMSNLVSVPTTIADIDAVVQSKFTLLGALPKSSSQYKSALADLKTLIGVEQAPIKSLVKQVSDLSSTMMTTSDTIQTATSTGTLKELQDAFETEIKALTKAISDAHSTIDSDNRKIVGLGFAAGAAIVVGLVGLVNIWNPVGWILIAGGAVGAYFAISEILALKGQIATLEATIKTDEAWKSDDSKAAAALNSFSNTLNGIAKMTASAQQELTELENLYDKLGDDIKTALSELDDSNFSEAQKEWNTIVNEVSFLKDITAYVWPSPVQLTDPTALSAAGSTLYSIDNAGQTYSIASGGTSWTALPNTSLSVSAKGSLVTAIDGAPVPNPSTGNPPKSTFYAKEYANGQWTSISDFAIAQVTTDGTSVYGVKQDVADRKVYQYSGTGTGWTALPALPNSDSPQLMAIANGTLYCLGTNTSELYSYSNSAWTVANKNTFLTITGNGHYLASINSANQAAVLDTSTGTTTNTYSSAQKVAQLSNGDQYVIGVDQSLYHISASAPSSAALVKTDVVDVVASDTDQVFCTDNTGFAYSVSGTTTTKLPAYPSKQS